MQLGELLSRHSGPLLKAGLPLIRNLLKPLCKSISAPFWLKAGTSATDAAIQNKYFGSDKTTLVLLQWKLQWY